MRNGHNKDAPGPLRRAEGKPTSYPGLFQGPKRLGFFAWALQAWELAPAHRLLQVALMDLPPSLFCQGRGVPYLSWGVRRRLAGERAMTRVLDDLLIFACATALVTGIVLAAARLLI